MCGRPLQGRTGFPAISDPFPRSMRRAHPKEQREIALVALGREGVRGAVDGQCALGQCLLQRTDASKKFCFCIDGHTGPDFDRPTGFVEKIIARNRDHRRSGYARIAFEPDDDIGYVGNATFLAKFCDVARSLRASFDVERDDVQLVRTIFAAQFSDDWIFHGSS